MTPSLLSDPGTQSILPFLGLVVAVAALSWWFVRQILLTQTAPSLAAQNLATDCSPAKMSSATAGNLKKPFLQEPLIENNNKESGYPRAERSCTQLDHHDDDGKHDAGGATTATSVLYDHLGRRLNVARTTSTGNNNKFFEDTSLGNLLEVHKALWLPVAILCMLITDNFSTRPALMAGLFGAYGVNWVLKSNLFPDLQFYNSEKAKIQGILDYVGKFCLIGVYFLYPIVSCCENKSENELYHTGAEDAKSTAASSTSSSSLPAEHLANQQQVGRDEITWLEITVGCLFFSVGSFFHYAADAQKYFQLKYSPGRLITDGFFSVVRHPSYFGEILIWLGMTVVAGATNLYAWIPVVWLLVITVVVGVPEKEQSLSRYGEEFAEWKRKVPMLVPGAGWRS